MMVIPFSRSRSILSITRSWTISLLRKIPLCQSMASTREVFLWSTWAITAILRMVCTDCISSLDLSDAREPEESTTYPARMGTAYRTWPRQFGGVISRAQHRGAALGNAVLCLVLVPMFFEPHKVLKIRPTQE